MNVQKDALAKRFGFLKLSERSEGYFEKLSCRQFWLHLCLHKGGKEILANQKWKN
jgi:hypothetical protein